LPTNRAPGGGAFAAIADMIERFVSTGEMMRRSHDQKRLMERADYDVERRLGFQVQVLTPTGY
jgi:hypothetical protein